jgi:hypothetical protein
MRLLIAASLSLIAGGVLRAVEPVANAHSHNDYWRERPLLDALQHGFCSVEADIFLIHDELLVGHARDELQSEKTLESLYLGPLARRVRENAGRVFAGADRQFILLIDIKTEAEATYPLLHTQLAKHAEMLTRVDGGKLRRGAVTVIISGNRPSVEHLVGEEKRFVGLDGRTSDLDSELPAHVMPMISDNWTSQFTWTGDGPMPESERTKLQEIVRKAHAADRVVRFWATPESEAVWRELRSAGVDLINTDQLDRLAKFLRSNK